MTEFQAAALAAGILPGAMEDVRTRFAVALGRGEASADDPAAFLAGLGRAGAHLFRRSGGGGSRGSRSVGGPWASPQSEPPIRVTRYDLARGGLAPGVLEAIASGEIQVTGTPPGTGRISAVPSSNKLGREVEALLVKEPAISIRKAARLLKRRTVDVSRSLKRMRPLVVPDEG
jgi:hypothetical protein